MVFHCVIQLELKEMLRSQLQEEHQEERSRILHLTLAVEHPKPPTFSLLRVE